MTRKKELIESVKVLRKEVEVLTTRLKPNGTGYLHTTIDTLNSRIDEMMIEAMGDTGEDVYDGYQEARLRSIQDSAAGKPNSVRDAYLHSSRVKDDVEFNGPFGMEEKKYEHTKEYYDKNRNRPMEGEDLLFTEGLSNRSMKQKHGQAVMTTSEMMQEELEPLPINTFE